MATPSGRRVNTGRLGLLSNLAPLELSSESRGKDDGVAGRAPPLSTTSASLAQHAQAAFSTATTPSGTPGAVDAHLQNIRNLKSWIMKKIEVGLWQERGWCSIGSRLDLA